MCYITLIFGLLAMGLAVIANVILMESNDMRTSKTKSCIKNWLLPAPS